MFTGQLIKAIIENQEKSRAAEVEFLRGRITALENCILEMKREGFQAPPLTQQFRSDLLNEEIMGAIGSIASEGTTLFSDLLDFARARQIENVPDDEIADSIIKGNSFKGFD